MTTDMASAPPEDDAPGGTFAKPAPLPPAKAEALRQAERREDDPPPEVPRDQWERPIIVLLDGSGAVSYLRASKLGKVKRSRAIERWDWRNIVYGMSRANHLVVRAQGVRTLTAGPDIVVLEDVAEKARVVAGADAGAMTGSGMHALHARRAAGEDLSWLSPTTLGCLDAITALLDPRIFEIIVTEGDDDLGRTFVVHDGLRAAGSFDLVVRLLVDLTWPDGVTIPAGTILVVDLKTGKITSAPYWDMEFTGQQLVYAEGTPYRPGRTHLADPKVRSVKNVIKVTDQPGENGRISWQSIGVPERPCQRWSLILHVPALSPGDAHWERVDLDQAREDAAAARAVWDRDRVSRADRFLALPAAALVVPGVELPRADSAQPLDTDVSTGDETHHNPRLHAILRERVMRADSTDQVDAIYDAWGKSPTWDDQLTADCQAAYDRLTPPADPAACDRCNYDRHDCPGCGIPVPHGKDCCRRCELRLLLENADDQDTLIVLWEAHAPVEATELGTGDGLWDEGEHTPAAQRRDAELTEADIAGEARQRVSYPVTITEEDWTPDLITLWCHECVLPPEHPQGDDPRAWCDCDPDDTCMDSGKACRNRAHDPDDCPHRPTEDEPEQQPETDAAETGPDWHPDDAGNLVRDVPAEPGPFDSTMDLSDLRDLIEQALTTDTLDELYDAHCAVEQGGDGLWTDDLNALAQARYDELAAGTGVST